MKMYFLAVLLPKDLDERVRAHKQFMLEHFNCRVGLKSPAHLTLVAPFWLTEEKEQDLINDVDQLSENVSSFLLDTDNFSAFRPRTIFIAVKESSSLGALKSKIDDFFSGRDYKMKKEQRAFHPHITIATRDLHKKAFAEAWKFFESKSFIASFKAEGLSVLRHNGTMWDVIHTGRFREV
jgi:2'-5' RNA ligase